MPFKTQIFLIFQINILSDIRHSINKFVCLWTCWLDLLYHISRNRLCDQILPLIYYKRTRHTMESRQWLFCLPFLSKCPIHPGAWFTCYFSFMSIPEFTNS